MKAYFGSKISGHMIKTPEGFLICKEVPIARTGTQQYRGFEFGGDDPMELYDVHRPEEEVFSNAALASFEGKPVVDEHPRANLDPTNISQYIKGVCRDVRRGEGNLSECMVADLIIYDKELITKIEGGKRDISCGYDCLWVKDGDKSFTQKEIRGNHVAVVTKGRAGHKVSIRDSENNGGKLMSRKHSLWGRMFKIFACDADTTPEDLEQAAKLRPADDEDEPQAPAAPKKEEKPVIDADELDARLSRIEDALADLAKGRKEEVEPVNDEDEPEETDEDYTIENEPGEETEDDDPLGKLEDELNGKKEPEATDEDQVEVDPKVINQKEHPEQPEAEDDGEECIDPNADEAAVRDAALGAIKALKPLVAKLHGSERKQAADSLAGLIRGSIADRGYKTVMNAARHGHRAMDTAMNDYDLGRQIRDKYNPHYNHKK